MSRLIARGLVAIIVVTLFVSGASAKTLTVAVYLPQANFSSNAQVSAYARRLASAFTKATPEEIVFEGRAFASKGDLQRFVKAGRVDFLVADGLFHATQGGGSVVAHAVVSGGASGPQAALYVSPGTSVKSLKGKVVSVAAVGKKAARFYANTVLSGELNPNRYFKAIRQAKDAHGALGAVKARAAAGAFAPAGHPAASGLKAVVTHGRIPLAVLVAVKPSSLPEGVKSAVLKAITGAGRGGGIAGWRGGGGKALSRARGAMNKAARVDSALPLLAPADYKTIKPPRLRLNGSGTLPRPTVGKAAIYPTLPE